jgi:hypothetical protein
VGNLTIPQVELRRRTAKGPGGPEANPLLTLGVIGPRSLKGVLLLGPHHAYRWVTWGVKQRRQTEQGHPMEAFEPLQPSQTCLIIPMRTWGPGIGLINELHSFQHQQTQMRGCLFKFRSQLRPNSAGFADERWGNPGARVHKTPVATESTATWFAHPDAPQMIYCATRDKSASIQLKTRYLSLRKHSQYAQRGRERRRRGCDNVDGRRRTGTVE